MKSCVIIYNPKSGKGIREKQLIDATRILKEYDYQSTIIKTEYKGHATKIVEELKFIDLVITIGGDGTFNESMRGNLKRKKRLLLAHIPIGTTNDIGMMYGYKKNLINNFKLLLNGEEKCIDICTINSRPFVYSAAIGKFVNISYDTPRNLKKKYGYFAYLIMAFKEFKGKTKLYDITYKINGEEINDKASFVMISNANHIAGIEHFYKNVKLNDNMFEILIFNKQTKKDIAKGLYHLKTSDITKLNEFKFYRTNNFEIKFNNIPDTSWSLDGEKYIDITDKFKIEIVKNVKILLPKKNIKKLFIN